MVKKKTVLILTVLGIVAFLLRWWLMPSNLFFGPEQGRDFLAVRDILGGKLTLIGAKTDISGIFHGPVYYYLAALPFALGRGNPLIVAAFLIFLQSIAVVAVYKLAVAFAKRRQAGIICAGLFAVSFQAIVYARWVANPQLSIPLSVLFMFALMRFLEGNKKYLVAAAFLYGLLGQAEFINFLLFGVIGAVIFFAYLKHFIKTPWSVWGISIAVGLATSFGTYILFDLRHQFLITKSIIGLLMGKSGYRVSVVTSTIGAFRVLFEQAALSIGLAGWRTGLVVAAACVYGLRKQNVLLLWLLLPPVTLAMLRTGMLDQLYAGVIAAVIIGLGLFLENIFRYHRGMGYVLFGIVIAINAYGIGKNLPANRRVFYQVEQPGVRYADEIAAIDWIYLRADRRPFSFEAYTIPYFIADAWKYLLWYYGKRTYGYLPDSEGRKLMYAVIQKDNLNPAFYERWYAQATRLWGVRSATTTIGDFRVEEWSL